MVYTKRNPAKAIRKTSKTKKPSLCYNSLLVLSMLSSMGGFIGQKYLLGFSNFGVKHLVDQDFVTHEVR